MVLNFSLFPARDSRPLNSSPCLLACFVVALLPLACSRSKTQDKVIMVEDEDPEMKAAIAKARSTLPVFWKTLEQPTKGESKFALKVKITDASGTEFFWDVGIEKKDGKVHGTINNDPNIVKSVKNGQRMEITDELISDWLFMRNGKMVGN